MKRRDFLTKASTAAMATAIAPLMGRLDPGELPFPSLDSLEDLMRRGRSPLIRPVTINGLPYYVCFYSGS